MKIPHILFVAFFNLIFTNATNAQETLPSHVPHVVIVGDQSGSMHSSGNIYRQTNGIAAAVEQYFHTCSELRVTYIAWGSTTAEPVPFLLHEASSRTEFATELRQNLSAINLSGTLHAEAFGVALQYVSTVSASSTVIVFITDEPGYTLVSLDLPLGVSLIKVSIGKESTAEYLAALFMPGVGQHFHANGSADLQSVIDNVFATMVDLCIG